MVENVEVAVGIMSYVAAMETEVTSTSRKCPIFPWGVPLVFQDASPVTEKSHPRAENVRTSGIGSSRNRSWPFS